MTAESAPPASDGASARAASGITHLLYLHGFRSSPQSTKARTMAAWMTAQRPEVIWWCPQLPPSPHEALKLLRTGIVAWPAEATGIVGSSLGGFYATALAERLGCRAVLLNPAVDPARDLTRHIGETTTWHGGDRFFFRPEFIAELRAETPVSLTEMSRYLAVIAKGDELLDWTEMQARYRGANIKLLEGSDHALSDFDAHLPDVLRFLGLAP